MGGPVAETTGGQVSGTRDRGVHVFRGIPYGSPPVGRLRFRPPVPAERWDGVLDAAGYPPSCPQGIGSRAPGPEAEELSRRAAVFGMAMAQERQDEACLSLNVWTPALDAGGNRPVMFRIHGGGYSSGSGSSPWHVGTNLCLRGDVVVVTMNHRLGVLGFLYLEGLGGEAWSGSGNAGMLDLVLALGWVRDNIAAFGGDPGNVTIFGESGGGMKTSTLLAMPAARGLFHRAIVQSGPQLRVREPAAAIELSGRLLAEVGVAPQRLDDLADVPLQDLLDAQLRLIGPGASLGFGPVLDGCCYRPTPWTHCGPARRQTSPFWSGGRATRRRCSGGWRARLNWTMTDCAVACIGCWARAPTRRSPSTAASTLRRRQHGCTC